MNELRSLICTLNELIESRKPFVTYRMPEEKWIHFISSDREASTFSDISLLDDTDGFAILPFSISASHPGVVIPIDANTKCVSMNASAAMALCNLHVSDAQPAVPSQPDEHYRQVFNTFHDALTSRRYDKLVLSRSKTCTLPDDFSAARTFLEACARYVHSYVFLCHTAATGTWMGCSPEILLSSDEREWHTVALAGTQMLQNNTLPLSWSTKCREEQAYVARFIRTQLASLGIHARESGPHTAKAASLAHLKTDFYFPRLDHYPLSQLLRLLHPTPAVCGLPKDDACRFIIAHEGYDRSYYSGYVGRIRPGGRTDLYVNLRCMQLHESCATLYAGGGLLASSLLDDEWTETQNKMDTIHHIISSLHHEKV